MIPIVDLKGQYLSIKKEIMESVEKVLDSCQFILGDEVGKLEEEIARYTGRRYAVGVANGTDAILLALKAYGIKEGDGVITSAFTYYATAGAIARCGARPVFCDIDPKTYNISPEKLEELLRNTPACLADKVSRETNAIRNTVKAVVPVHLYGQMAEMDEILEIAKRYNLKVIEDAAQAFGAEYLPLPAFRQAGQVGKGKKAGSMGDAGCFSFYPGKNLGAYGDAGMIVTDDKNVADILQVYRNQGNKIKYHHIVIGHNSRLDAIQAAILRIKLRHIDKWNERRQAIAKFYDEGLKGLGIVTPFVSKNTKHTYHLYVIRFKNRDKKDRVERALNDKGVDARTYYPIPLHLQECFKYLGYKKGDFLEAEKASEETLAIPIYPEIRQEDQEFIVTVIRENN